MGIEIIETGDPDAFKQYLLEYDNTICGRHPISVFLHVSASLFGSLLLLLFIYNNNNYYFSGKEVDVGSSIFIFIKTFFMGHQSSLARSYKCKDQFLYQRKYYHS